MQSIHGMSFFGTDYISIDTLDPTQANATRAALVVYRRLLGQPHVLLISARRDRGRLTLPGGKVDAHETALDSAVRETFEESGVLTDQHQLFGHYTHEKTNGKLFPTQTYVARFAGYEPGHERRDLHWLTLADLSDSALSIRPAVREHVERVFETLPAFIGAA